MLFYLSMDMEGGGAMVGIQEMGCKAIKINGKWHLIRQK